MLYAIKIADVSGSQPLRDIHRKEHLDYLKTFDDQTIFAGPFLTEDCQTELGSMRFLDFPDRAAAVTLSVSRLSEMTLVPRRMFSAGSCSASARTNAETPPITR